MSRDINSLNLEYSISKIIEDRLSIISEIRYTGKELPKELPYCYIRNVPSTHTILSKGKESIESTYNFEVLLFANSKYELESLRHELTNILLFDDIPYYGSDGNLTNVVFSVGDTISESPIFVNELENETSYHQISYDFGIKVVKHKNNK